MKPIPWWVWALAGLAVFGGGAVVFEKVRGLRNNNPGNIRESSGDVTVWVGERATDDDPAFEEFEHMWQGVRAAAIVFNNYQRNYGLHTITDLLHRWAPPSENDTRAYVDDVSSDVGVNSDTPIDLRNPGILYKYLRSVFRHENGPPADLAVSEDDMRHGIAAALA